MTDRVGALARRVEGDDFFLATALADYSRNERLDDRGLAAALNCSEAVLAPLRLCRRPRPEPDRFREDVDRISARFGVNAEVLAEAVRRSDVLDTMRRNANGEGRGTLMAARDRDRDGGEGEDRS